MAKGFIQGTRTGFSVAATYPLAYGSNNTAGNMLIAMVSTQGTASQFTISDSQANTWQVLFSFGTSNPAMIVACAFNCKAGANTVTATKSGSAVTSALYIAEYGGPLSQVDVQAFNGPIGGLTTYTAPSITTSNTSDTVILITVNTGTNVTFPAPYTNQVALENFSGWADDIITSSQILAPTSAAISNLSFTLGFHVAFNNGGQSAIQFQQAASLDQGNGSSTSWTLSFPNPVKAGSLLAMSSRPNSANITSISDNLNGTWITVFNNSNTRFDYFPNSLAGSVTITVALSPAGHMALAAAEYSGVKLVNPLDKFSGVAQLTSTTSLSPFVTPSVNGELIIGFGSSPTQAGVVAASTGGFTIRAQANIHIEDFIQGAAAPIASTVLWPFPQLWTQNVVTFFPLTQQNNSSSLFTFAGYAL